MCGGGGDTDIDETPQERELARVMTEKFGFAKDNIIPLINEYKSRIRATTGDYERAQGAASGAASAAFKEARGNIEASERNRGAGPTSGSSLSKAADLAAREGSSRGGRSVDASEAVTRREYTGLQNVVAMGSGQEANVQRNLTDIAGSSVRDSITDAREAQYQNEARASNIGSAVGIGLRAYEGTAANDSPRQSDTWRQRESLSDYEYLNTGWGG